MHFTDADITHLGKLIRLAQTPAQRQTYAEQLSRVVDYVDQINQSEPLATEDFRREAVTPYDLREDVVVQTPPDYLVAQAPKREGTYVVSPPTT